MNEPLTKEERDWWSINVTGYGRFAYYGTSAEAEDMRKSKAEWEGGRGSKRRATVQEIVEERKSLKWKRDNDYPLDERELEAIT